MAFISTRRKAAESSFQDAIFQGLAPDGGLYEFKTAPDLTETYGGFTKETPFTQIAGEMTYALLKDEITKADAEKITSEAFPFSPALKPIDDGISVLELFHGPSCAFKDFGASFLAHSMAYFLDNRHRHAVILTATSGDTGSAVAQAFHNVENIDVVILYPSGRVSPLQEKQLTTLGGNVHALEVNGAFDDCQRMVKEAFLDKTLQTRLTLTSANSINLGRLLPQSFYYVWARAQYAEEKGDVLKPGKKDFVFCVPSGNFGNLTAGVLAWKWGMQTNRFIAATNINDVVPEYLKTGIFSPRASKHTYSNAMDVGNPSNFERLESIFGNNVDEMKSMLSEEVVSDKETLETMKEVFLSKNEFLDPHTAVGYLASKRFLSRAQAPSDIVTLSTAHPGKFGEVVVSATGRQPPLPDRLRKALEKEKQSTQIGSNLDELSAFLLDTF